MSGPQFLLYVVLPVTRVFVKNFVVARVRQYFFWETRQVQCYGGIFSAEQDGWNAAAVFFLENSPRAMLQRHFSCATTCVQCCNGIFPVKQHGLRGRLFGLRFGKLTAGGRAALYDEGATILALRAKIVAQNRGAKVPRQMRGV